MECKFKPGDRVVCVNAVPVPANAVWLEDEKPEESQIYTITSVHLDWDAGIVVHLAEIQRAQEAVEEWGPQVGYDWRRFRPAEDIEQFRRLVAKLPTNLEAVE